VFHRSEQSVLWIDAAGGRRIAPVDDVQGEDTVVRERVLLFEALTLLAQRQSETEMTLVEQVNRNSSRIAAVEQLCTQLETRLADIDERLSRLAGAVHADPGLPQRVAMLQAQIQRLGRPADQPPAWQPAITPAPSPRLAQADPRPAHLAAADLPPARASYVPVPQAPPLRTDVPPRQPASAAVSRRSRPVAYAAARSGDGLLERINAMTGQDRASMALMAAGVLVVGYAILAQLRIG
jgi:hypothetical protein